MLCPIRQNYFVPLFTKSV
uniref:Uncharacterized protein n=1 Tax=Anguilla anguilla TaxID=7936 RepID=A0A0E9UJU2_ANGAN